MAVRRGVVDVVRGDNSRADRFGHCHQPGEQPVVVRQPVPLQLDPEPLAAEDVRELAGSTHGPRPVAGQDGLGHRATPAARQTEQPSGMARHVLDGQHRRALCARQLPCRDQPAEVGVAGLCLGQECQVRAVGQRHLGADHRPDPAVARRTPKLDRAV